MSFVFYSWLFIRLTASEPGEIQFNMDEDISFLCDLELPADHIRDGNAINLDHYGIYFHFYRTFYG
jgi:hypothetical protein